MQQLCLWFAGVMPGIIKLLELHSFLAIDHELRYSLSTTGIFPLRPDQPLLAADNDRRLLSEHSLFDVVTFNAVPHLVLIVTKLSIFVSIWLCLLQAQLSLILLLEGLFFHMQLI